MAESTPDLDRAYDRVTDLEFGPTLPYVNHGPMAAEALACLDLDGQIGGWVDGFLDGFADHLVTIGTGTALAGRWEDALGDGARLPEWSGLFERSIEDEGWASVVDLWVPRLMPALSSALFHGVIRTAHAVRAIEATDSPARRAELARALASWASWYGRGQPVDEVDAVGDLRLEVTGAAAEGARYYVGQPTIFNLHGVTGAMAVALLADRLREADGARALAQLRAEHRALYRGQRPTEVRPEGEGWDTTAVERAAQSGDAHQIKLVEACHRGFAATGDAAFPAAARTVTGA